MTAVWSWLVVNGLFHDLLSACILVPIMRLMALKPLQRVERAVKDVRDDIRREIFAHYERESRALDTEARAARNRNGVTEER